MESQLYEMYLALPSPAICPIYIKGYTEALQFVDGVRVVPSPSFYEDLPFRFKRYFNPVQYPAYYIPIKVGRSHFGFILKGQGKMSSRLASYYPFFNLDSLMSPRPYVIVTEGIKDAGIFLERGHPAMAMLTSGMSEETSMVFKEYKKIPILVQDKDAAGDMGYRQFQKSMSSFGLPSFRVRPFRHKDTGDYYDKPELRSYVELTYDKVQSIVSGLLSSQTDSSFLQRS
jgi:hypothetical protein